jgi:hypothetical protein
MSGANDSVDRLVIEQQCRALDCVADMRMAASRYRQMGVKALAREYETQAAKAEKWVLVMCLSPEEL